MGINKIAQYDNYEQAFQINNDAYPWYLLHLETVHPDFRYLVLEELIKKLNEKQVSPKEM